MREVVTIVSGLPRSGTSMMMRMLEAGGMGIVTDSVRSADEDNPRGYYEFEDVKRIKDDASWLEGAKGKAVKMVSMLLYGLPQDRTYRVIFMRREIGEVIASQRVMLERMGERNIPEDDEMGRLYKRHLEEIERWLEGQQNIKVLYMNYKDVLEDPQGGALRISRFLGDSLNVEDMVRAVDMSLYRQRSQAKNSNEKDLPHAGDMEKEDSDKIEAQLKALGYM